MTPEGLAEEQRLIAARRAMAEQVREGVARGDPPALWREQRAEIARLRRRIRQMKFKHLGHRGGRPGRRAAHLRRLGRAEPGLPWRIQGLAAPVSEPVALTEPGEDGQHQAPLDEAAAHPRVRRPEPVVSVVA
jgi:hypothetical protein